MRIFSRLTMFVFLGIALMLVGGAADAQEPFLEVLGSTGFDQSSNVGDPLEVTFRAGFGGAVQAGIPLQITATSSIKVTSPLPVPGTHRTGLGGILIVKGTLIKANVDARIHAVWVLPSGGQRSASAKIQIDDDPADALIVVNSPHPGEDMEIGSTFTQDITIENRHATRSTLPLSAWQMDVVFNPLILEVVGVSEGDFLTEAGTVSTYYTEKMSSGRISVSQARGGQTGIALAPGDKGTLLTITFKVLVLAEEGLQIHNILLLSSEDTKDPDGTLDRISYSILVTDVSVATHQSSTTEDVNQDGMVNILDLVAVAGSIGSVSPNPRADVNGDGFVNVLDLITIYTSPHWTKSVPSIEGAKDSEPALNAPSVSDNLDPATVRAWIDLAQVEDDGSAIFNLGIANLEALLASRIPSETKLLLNYPNPFNPETWIPYQLSEAANVTVAIHSMNGSLIRTLELGHQAVGGYQSKSRAAYWDGRNAFGERVASGLYFYTLTAGDFMATRKLLIRK